MHDWPNSTSLAPADDLAREIDHSGSLVLTAGELGARFGMQRLTANARAQIAEDLNEADLMCVPALADADRIGKLTLTPAPRRTPSAVGAPTRRRQISARWLAAAAAVLLLLILAAAAGRGATKQDAPVAGENPPATTTATALPKPAPAPEPVDATAQVRQEADAMASRGRWVAAVALLRDNHDTTHADNLARRGAHRMLRSAHRALRHRRYGTAKSLAARSDRLFPSLAAADLRELATDRSAAQKKAKRLARDGRFCSASEKTTVDLGGAVPSGCGAYARRQRVPTPDLSAPAPDDSTPDPGSATPSTGGELGCDGDPGATPYPQFPGQRDGDGDGCYGES